jgi:hypothetical protein
MQLLALVQDTSLRLALSTACEAAPVPVAAAVPAVINATRQLAEATAAALGARPRLANRLTIAVTTTLLT